MTDLVAFDHDVVHRMAQLLISASILIDKIESTENNAEFAEHVVDYMERVMNIYYTPKLLEEDIVILSTAIALMNPTPPDPEQFDA